MLKLENRALERLIAEHVRPDLKMFLDGVQPAERLSASIEALLQIDRHYLRKENLFFPKTDRPLAGGSPDARAKSGCVPYFLL